MRRLHSVPDEDDEVEDVVEDDDEVDELVVAPGVVVVGEGSVVGVDGDVEEDDVVAAVSMVVVLREGATATGPSPT